MGKVCIHPRWLYLNPAMNLSTQRVGFTSYCDVNEVWHSLPFYNGTGEAIGKYMHVCRGIPAGRRV